MDCADACVGIGKQSHFQTDLVSRLILGKHTKQHKHQRRLHAAIIRYFIWYPVDYGRLADSRHSTVHTQARELIEELTKFFDSKCFLMLAACTMHDICVCVHKYATFHSKFVFFSARLSIDLLIKRNYVACPSLALSVPPLESRGSRRSDSYLQTHTKA